MKVSYAINEVIGGAGIGTPAYYACGALAKKRMLGQVLALGYRPRERMNFSRKVEVAVPFGKLFSNLAFGVRKVIPSFPAYTLRDNLFDVLAVRKLEPCDIFHGWNHHCLRMLQKAKGFGAVTIVERGSTHIDFQNHMLQQEYRRYRIPFQPIEHAVVQKCKKEFAIADYLLVNSPFSRQTFLDAGISAEKLRYVPRGVDVQKFSAGTHDPSAQFIVLYAGLISLRKGVQYLLEAWEQLQLPNAQLVLVGTVVPDAQAVLRKYLRNPSIVYKGFVEDLRNEYRAASVFVLPSLEEGSAKVTFEAMAAGIPVITTPNSGSVIRNGKEGFIVPIREAKVLQRRIRYFFDNRDEVRTFGVRGTKTARQYTWERYQQNMLKMYRSVR